MVVIFLDILGSKEMKSFEEKYRIHEIFHQSIQESQERQYTNAKKHVVYDRKLFSFSDCAYIFYKYNVDIKESKKDLDKLLQTALFNTSLITLKLLNEGYLIRGGVTYGEAYYDDMSFFGPAVEEAYLIESQRALTPRVMIDPQYGEKLLKFEKETYENVFGPNSPHYHRLPKRSYIPTIVIPDSEDFILNYLYILEMEGNIDLGEINISHNQIKKNIGKSISNKLKKNIENQNITKKLKWMENYNNFSKLSLVNSTHGINYLI